jgi:hypothetical protein
MSGLRHCTVKSREDDTNSLSLGTDSKQNLLNSFADNVKKATVGELLNTPSISDSTTSLKKSIVFDTYNINCTSH